MKTKNLLTNLFIGNRNYDEIIEELEKHKNNVSDFFCKGHFCNDIIIRLIREVAADNEDIRCKASVLLKKIVILFGMDIAKLCDLGCIILKSSASENSFKEKWIRHSVFSSFIIELIFSDFCHINNYITNIQNQFDTLLKIAQTNIRIQNYLCVVLIMLCDKLHEIGHDEVFYKYCTVSNIVTSCLYLKYNLLTPVNYTSLSLNLSNIDLIINKHMTKLINSQDVHNNPLLELLFLNIFKYDTNQFSLFYGILLGDNIINTNTSLSKWFFEHLPTIIQKAPEEAIKILFDRNLIDLLVKAKTRTGPNHQNYINFITKLKTIPLSKTCVLLMLTTIFDESDRISGIAFYLDAFISYLGSLLFSEDIQNLFNSLISIPPSFNKLSSAYYLHKKYYQAVSKHVNEFLIACLSLYFIDFSEKGLELFKQSIQYSMHSFKENEKEYVFFPIAIITKINEPCIGNNKYLKVQKLLHKFNSLLTDVDKDIEMLFSRLSYGLIFYHIEDVKSLKHFLKDLICVLQNIDKDNTEIYWFDVVFEMILSLCLSSYKGAHFLGADLVIKYSSFIKESTIEPVLLLLDSPQMSVKICQSDLPRLNSLSMNENNATALFGDDIDLNTLTEQDVTQLDKMFEQNFSSISKNKSNTKKLNDINRVVYNVFPILDIICPMEWPVFILLKISLRLLCIGTNKICVKDKKFSAQIEKNIKCLLQAVKYKTELTLSQLDELYKLFKILTKELRTATFNKYWAKWISIFLKSIPNSPFTDSYNAFIHKFSVFISSVIKKCLLNKNETINIVFFQQLFIDSPSLTSNTRILKVLCSYGLEIRGHKYKINAIINVWITLIANFTADPLSLKKYIIKFLEKIICTSKLPKTQKLFNGIPKILRVIFKKFPDIITEIT
ncbi:hypothetical protein HZS_1463, partial [Henneguya salminicola]